MNCPECESDNTRYAPKKKLGRTYPQEVCRDCGHTFRSEKGKLGRSGVIRHYGLTAAHVQAAHRCVELMEAVILAPSVGGPIGARAAYQGTTPDDVATRAAPGAERTQLGILALAVELYREQVSLGERVHAIRQYHAGEDAA